ncbi:MAG TPA: glycosyltransferase [Xanthobacteraceae bacterium]|nr:glycosyltransferase [Xanthobacteraceae bacterium]
MTETISVVIPVFNNRATLVELGDRIRRTVEPDRTLELILVDDCSSDDSWSVIAEVLRDSPARVVAIRTPRNLGQHGAILLGLSRARGAWCAVLDADLQDRPEAIADLLAAADGHDAVFAGRRGRHQGLVRLLTGKLYRALLGALAGVPSDAGTFCVLRRAGVERILALPVTTPSFIAMIGLARLRATSIPIQREQRRAGYSAYSTGLRLALAWRMLRCVLEYRFRPADSAIGATIGTWVAASTVRESAGAVVHPGEPPL